MKRILVILLALIMIISLFACGKNSEVKPESTPNAEEPESTPSAEEPENSSVSNQQEELSIIHFMMEGVGQYELIDKGLQDHTDKQNVKYRTVVFNPTEYVEDKGIMLNDVDTGVNIIEILKENNNQNTGVFLYDVSGELYIDFFNNSDLIYSQTGFDENEYPNRDLTTYCDLIINPCSYESLYGAVASYINKNYSDTETVGFAARIAFVPKEQSAEYKSILSVCEELSLNDFTAEEPISWYLDITEDSIFADLNKYVIDHDVEILVANEMIQMDVLSKIKQEHPELKILYLGSTKGAIEMVSEGIVEAVIATDFYEMGQTVAEEMINILNGKKQTSEINLEPTVISGEKQAQEHLEKISQ